MNCLLEWRHSFLPINRRLCRAFEAAAVAALKLHRRVVSSRRLHEMGDGRRSVVGFRRFDDRSVAVDHDERFADSFLDLEYEQLNKKTIDL